MGKSISSIASGAPALLQVWKGQSSSQEGSVERHAVAPTLLVPATREFECPMILVLPMARLLGYTSLLK